MGGGTNNTEQERVLFYQGKNTKERSGALFYAAHNFLNDEKEIPNITGYTSPRGKESYLPQLPPLVGAKALIVSEQEKIYSSHQQILEPVGGNKKTSTK